MTDAIGEALRMIDIFASVGATRFHVTKTDINHKLLWGKSYTPDELRQTLPATVRVAETLRESTILDKKTGSPTGKVRAGANLMVRPMTTTSAFIQLDDLAEEKLALVRPVAFLTVQTSPGNHQAWIAVPAFANDQDRKDFTRRVKKQVKADTSATGSVRLAGTTNFKAKYTGNFPKVAIIDATPGRITTPTELDSLSLVAPPEPPPTVLRLKTSRKESLLSNDRPWPDYEACARGAPPTADGGGPDRSLADFFFCMMAAQRGHGVDTIEERLLEVSAKAQENARRGDAGYAHITAQNAVAAAKRGNKRGRG